MSRNLLDYNWTDQQMTAATIIVAFIILLNNKSAIRPSQFDCVFLFSFGCVRRNVLTHKSGRNWRRPDVTGMETS